MPARLHTTPAQLSDYAAAAHQKLARLGNVIARLEDSNAAADATYPDTELRDELLTCRLEEESWMASDCQQLADLVYLLAVGNCGPSAAATNNPTKRSRQAHSQRRSEALERINAD